LGDHRINDFVECAADDDTCGQIDDVAAHEKLSEFFEHKGGLVGDEFVWPQKWRLFPNRSG
jgi:hypothetical protein